MLRRKKILLTTSRKPTSKIRSFCRDFAVCLPDIVRINRGKLNLDGIVEKVLEINADRVVIVDRWEGGHGKVHLFLLKETSLTSVPPLIYIRAIKLRREFEMKKKPVQSFVVTTSQDGSFLGKKVAESLAHFFGIPFLSVEEAVSRYSASMHISANTSGRLVISFVFLPGFIEVGPRISVARATYFGEG